MSIKNIYKKTAIFLLAGAVLLFTVPVTVFAAPDTDITYAANASAKAGDTAQVTISTTGETSISTLGLRLYYDKEKLVYQGSQWAESLQNANSSMTLVSDVEYNGSQVLNISMISDGGYPSGGVLVTLVFAVQEGYTENPFKLELREITDGNLLNVETTTNIVFQDTAPGSSNGTGSSNGNSSSSGSTTNDQDASADGSSSNTTSAATTGTANSASSTSKLRPKTFQTGIEDLGTNFLFASAVFGMAGIVCIMIRRKLYR